MTSKKDRNKVGVVRTKQNMTMEKQTSEDVPPIQSVDFPLSFEFTGGYNPLSTKPWLWEKNMW